jgi:hypothetical protein
MGDIGEVFEESLGTLLDPFSERSEAELRRGARRAAEIPPELQFFLDRLRDLVAARVSGGGVTPFVEAPTAPRLSLTPLEEQLTGLGQQLAEALGAEPLQQAFAAAGGLTGGTPRLDLGGIEREVEPLLAPAIARRIEQERQGRLDLAEGLANIGAYEGSPLMEGRRRLAEATNRDIAEMISNAVMQERALRGREMAEGGDLAFRVGAAAPVLARGIAALPREVGVQQFGLEQSAAEQRAQMIQQALNLLLGGVGAGTDIFSTRAGTLIRGEELAQRQRAAELAFLGSLFSSAAGMAGGR